MVADERDVVRLRTNVRGEDVYVYRLDASPAALRIADLLQWAGVAAGTSWEWQAPTAPDQNFLHSTEGAPSAFVAFPVDEDTLVRLQACDLPHDPVIGGVGWPATKS